MAEITFEELILLSSEDRQQLYNDNLVEQELADNQAKISEVEEAIKNAFNNNQKELSYQVGTIPDYVINYFSQWFNIYYDPFNVVIKILEASDPQQPD